MEDFVEVTLASSDDFLKCIETLTRIGIASKQEKKLTQTCHILHKQGKYYIMHFLELYILDNSKYTHFSDNDKARRNMIVSLLEDWNLLRVVNKSAIESPRANMNKICIIPFKEKSNWKLCQKYTIGSKKIERFINENIESN